MKSLGQTCKMIRKNKAMTIADISDGIMSNSALSQFENDKITIKADLFLQILSKLNVTFDEFYLNHQFFDDVPCQEMFNSSLQKLLITKSDVDWSKLLNDENYYYSIDNNIRHQHNIVILKQMLRQIKNIEYSSNDTKIITSYLFSCEEWGFYELCLFNNSLNFLSTDYITNLSRYALKKANKYNKIYKHNTVEITVMLNIITKLINSDNDKLISDLLLSVDEKLQAHNNLMYEKNWYNFVKGLFLISINKFEEGSALCEKSIDIFKELELLNYAKIYEEEYSKFVSKMNP